MCGCEVLVLVDDYLVVFDWCMVVEIGCMLVKLYKFVVWGWLYGLYSWFDGDGVVLIDCNLYGFVVGMDVEVSSYWCVGIVGGVLCS